MRDGHGMSFFFGNGPCNGHIVGHGYMRMPRKNDEIVIWENIWMNLIITSRRDVME